MSAPPTSRNVVKPRSMLARKKPRRKMRQVRHGRLHDPDDVQPRSIHVNMRIDQPRHQYTTAAIDDLILAARRPRGYLADHAAFHKYLFSRAQRFRCAIEDPGRLKDDSSLHLHYLSGRLLNGATSRSSIGRLRSPREQAAHKH